MEALIAAALLAIVGMMLMTSLSSSIDAKEAVEATSGRYHLVRQALTRMCDELSQAYLSAHSFNASEVRSKTGFRGDRSEIQFTAFGYVPKVADSKHSDQRELGYHLGVDARTQEESLLRREQPEIDDEFDEGGREQTLLPGVKELEFEYWDPTKEDWTDSWDTEESATLNRLPSRVKITLTAVMENEREQTFVTQTKIWLTTPINFQN